MIANVYQSITNVPARYDALFSAAATESYFYRKDWFQLLETEVFARDRINVEVLGVEDANGTALAALPIVTGHVDRHKHGNHATGLANYYTSLFGVILDPQIGISEEVALTLAKAFQQHRPAFDTVRFLPMAQESVQYSVMNRALSVSGFAVQQFFSFGNWYLEVDGRSYEQYLESRPSILRSTISRKSKKFLKSEGRLEIIESLQDVDRGIEAYEKVYSASWKVPEPYPNFMRGLIRMAAQHNALRLGVAYVGNEPAAAQLWITENGIASIYKLAYDEKFEALSAGTVLTALLMQRAIDGDRVSVIDYLTGDDNYKKQWMSHRRERWGLAGYNKSTVLGSYSILREIYGGTLKRTAKQVAAKFRSKPEAPPVSAQAPAQGKETPESDAR